MLLRLATRFDPARTSLPRRRGTTTALAALMAAALLAGCGAGVGAPRATERSETRAPSGFPVTVTNCGVTTTYQHPPKRVVTMNQHVTEIMLALGLDERMVGTAYLDDKILPKYRDEYKRIPVLAERYPSYEVLLKATPDFVYGGFTSAFGESEGRSRQRLHGAGIKTHLSIGSCAEGSVGMREVRKEIRTIAKIFAVGDRAERLIERMNQQLSRVKRKLDGDEPVSVFVYDSGAKVPFAAGGSGIANEIVRLAGGHNIFANLDDGFVEVSWEQVIARKPEWIVILNYGSATVREKKQRLLKKPALAHIPAIEHKNFAVLPLSSAVVGTRGPRAVASLAEQLHSEQFR